MVTIASAAAPAVAAAAAGAESVGLAPSTPLSAQSKPARAGPAHSSPTESTHVPLAFQRAYDEAMRQPLDDCFVAGGPEQRRGWPVACHRVDGSRVCFFAAFEIAYADHDSLAPGGTLRYLIDSFADVPLNAADEADRRRTGLWDPQHITASYNHWSGRNVLRVLCTYRNEQETLQSALSLHAQFPTIASSSGFVEADEDVVLLEARVLTDEGKRCKLMADFVSGKTGVRATRWTVLEALLRCPCVIAGGRLVQRLDAA